MLKKVHISNFLSCQDTEIELDGITALIGRNAAGKSNILNAIEWCAQFAVGNEPLDKYLPQNVFNLEAKYNIEFLIDDKTFKYERNVNVRFSYVEDDAPDTVVTLVERLFCHIDNDRWEIIADREDGSAKHYDYDEEISIEINSEAPLISSLLSLLPKKRLNPSINKIFDYLSGIKYYNLVDEYRSSSSNSVIYGNDYKRWLAKNHESESSVVMRLLHLWHEDNKLLEELEALIGKNGLNLIKSIVIHKLDLGYLNQDKQKDHIYTVRFLVANDFVEYKQLSYGTQRVLTLLLALLYDKNSTLLIEQPEDGIHSGLLKKLLPLCFEYATVYNKQIIIATHSPDVINLLPPESIRLVKMTENGTKVSSLEEERIPFIRDYIENEGALFDFIESMDDE